MLYDFLFVSLNIVLPFMYNSDQFQHCDVVDCLLLVCDMFEKLCYNHTAGEYMCVYSATKCPGIVLLACIDR